MAIPASVQTLERELRGVFGTRLRSLVIYGLHASTPDSATRTMALVDALTEQDLRGCASRLAAWHAAGLATPLILPLREFDRSLDVFPIEFGVIVADHVIVSGAPPFERATVDPADLRRACEIQARSHLLHLREAFIETAGNKDALAVLIVDSAPPLNALLASVVRLENHASLDAEAAARHMEHLLNAQPGAISDVARLASGREIPAADAERIFPTYLAAMERLVEYVDRWAQR